MNVREIVGWLDRDHVAARRERTYRKNMRRLRTCVGWRRRKGDDTNAPRQENPVSVDTKVK